MPTKKQSGASTWTDPDDAPELTEEYFRNADVYEGERLVRRGRGRPQLEQPKEKVNLRLSVHVLEHFRSAGPGWQTRINAALEAMVSQEQRKR